MIGYPTLKGQQVIVPGDISSAAFWLVAGANRSWGRIIDRECGDQSYPHGSLEALELMGADITLENQREVAGEPVADLRSNIVN